MRRDIRRLSAILLLFGLGASISAAAWGQRVDEMQLLPPLGDASSTAEATPEAILTPDAIVTPDASSGVIISDIPSEAPWWTPGAWFGSPVWDFGAELGINGAEGNSQSFNILTAFNGKRTTEGNVLEWDLKYSKAQSDGVETQNFALLNSRWDWNFTPLWFLYNKNQIEYDEFKAFDLRLVLSGGLGRHLIKSERTTLTTRLGAGASREYGGPIDEWIPEANGGIDFEQKLSHRQTLKLTSDYYPAWEDITRDYRIVTNAYWEILLDEETNLSLKLGAVDRYDSTPNGSVPNDINYFATLLWKL